MTEPFKVAEPDAHSTGRLEAGTELIDRAQPGNDMPADDTVQSHGPPYETPLTEFLQEANAEPETEAEVQLPLEEAQGQPEALGKLSLPEQQPAPPIEDQTVKPGPQETLPLQYQGEGPKAEGKAMLEKPVKQKPEVAGMGPLQNQQGEPEAEMKPDSPGKRKAQREKKVDNNDAFDVRTVLWARLKGYPQWPAQVMSSAAAAKRLKGQTPKGQRLPIMFFGTKEICWVPTAAVMHWEAGVAKGFNDLSRKKEKRLCLAITEARDHIENGQLPKEWWYKSAHDKARPAKRRSVPPEGESQPADVPETRRTVKRRTAELPGKTPLQLKEETPTESPLPERFSRRLAARAESESSERVVQVDWPAHKRRSEHDETGSASVDAKRAKGKQKRSLRLRRKSASDAGKVKGPVLKQEPQEYLDREPSSLPAKRQRKSSFKAEADFDYDNKEAKVALGARKQQKRSRLAPTPKSNHVLGVRRSSRGSTKRRARSSPISHQSVSPGAAAPLRKISPHKSALPLSPAPETLPGTKQTDASLPSSLVQAEVPSREAENAHIAAQSLSQHFVSQSLSQHIATQSLSQPGTRSHKSGKPWEAVTVTITPHEKTGTVTVKLSRRKRKYIKSKQYSKKSLLGPHSRQENPVKVVLESNDSGVKVRLQCLAVQSGLQPREAARGSRKSGALRSGDLDSPAITSLQARASDSKVLPGGQAPLELREGVAPPRYVFLRRNCWPPCLPKPKRLAKDSISTCDCHPSQPGPESEVVRTEMEETAANADRSTRARIKGTNELGKVDCGPDCVNRQSFIHCDPRTCPSGEQCTNRPFHLLQLPKVTVFHTGDRGWGVRAEEFIPSGSFIVEYTGELMDKKEKQRRLEEQARNKIMDFYMMEHSPGIIIDARLKGNLARLINSSCAPNCETQKWRDAATDECRIGIFTKQDVMPGQELSYDYNFEHSGLAEAAGAYRCKCGAPNCRGTMDTQPQRLKDAYRRIDVFWDADQVYYRGTVNSYQAASGLHNIYYDDGQRVKERLAEMRHRWLPDDAELCIFGLEKDSLPEVPVVEPVQQMAAGSPKLVRSRRGGRPRPKGGRKRSAAEQGAPLLMDLQEPLLFDSFEDSKEDPKAEPLTLEEETKQDSKRFKLEAENSERQDLPAVFSNPGSGIAPPLAAETPIPVDPPSASEVISLAAQLDETVGVAKPCKGVASPELPTDVVMNDSATYDLDSLQDFLQQTYVVPS